MNPAFSKLDPAQTMGLTICREAGGEIPSGKIAVGTVILERVDHRDWDGKTIKEVCLKPRQFSCYDEADRGYKLTLHMAETWDASIATDFSLNECFGIALGMIDGRIPRDPELAAKHCCQYLNPAVAPRTREAWLSAGMTIIKKIDHHEFFAEKRHEKGGSK